MTGHCWAATWRSAQLSSQLHPKPTSHPRVPRRTALKHKAGLLRCQHSLWMCSRQDVQVAAFPCAGQHAEGPHSMWPQLQPSTISPCWGIHPPTFPGITPHRERRFLVGHSTRGHVPLSGPRMEWIAAVWGQRWSVVTGAGGAGLQATAEKGLPLPEVPLCLFSSAALNALQPASIVLSTPRAPQGGCSLLWLQPPPFCPCLNRTPDTTHVQAPFLLYNSIPCVLGGSVCVPFPGVSDGEAQGAVGGINSCCGCAPCLTASHHKSYRGLFRSHMLACL